MRSPAGRIGALYGDASTRTAVVATMERGGFAVVILDGPAPELVAQARVRSPDVVIFDLADGGVRGLRLVRDLRRALPRCAIVVLGPFETLRDEAIEAGAYELVGTDDLRDLQRCLERIGADLDARGSRVPHRLHVRSA